MRDTLLDELNTKKRELIVHYKRKQDNSHKQIDQIRSALEEIHKQILFECQRLQQTSEKLKEKAKSYIEDCTDSLSEKIKGKYFIDIKDLANYLKVEKEGLKKLTDQSESKSPNALDVHDILKKAKLQKTLRSLKKQQLEEEIKYLQKNVLSKDMLIYNPATSSPISNSEQKILNQKLEYSITELQRVISVSLLCNSSSDQSGKRIFLELQKERLKDCEILLMTETEKITKLMKYFQGQEFEIYEKLPLPLFLSANNHKFNLCQERETLIESQLDHIIGFPIPQDPIVSKMNHKFEDWEEKIEILRKKFKKHEKMY